MVHIAFFAAAIGSWSGTWIKATPRRYFSPKIRFRLILGFQSSYARFPPPSEISEELTRYSTCSIDFVNNHDPGENLMR